MREQLRLVELLAHRIGGSQGSQHDARHRPAAIRSTSANAAARSSHDAWSGRWNGPVPIDARTASTNAPRPARTRPSAVTSWNPQLGVATTGRSVARYSCTLLAYRLRVN